MKKVKLPELPESAIHKSIADLLDRALPRTVMWWHTPNGEKRDKITASILRGMGVKPGVPDLLLYDLQTGYLHAIEVKAKDGVLSEPQKAWRDKFAGSPTGRYAVVRSLEEAVQLLKEWWPERNRIVRQLAPGVVQTEVGA